MKWIYYPNPDAIWCYEDIDQEHYEIIWDLEESRPPQVVFNECNRPGFQQWAPTFVTLPKHWIFV